MPFPTHDDELPERWLAIMRRLMSMAPQDGQRPAILSINILVGSDGTPTNWSKPTVTVLEPRAADFCDTMLNLLTRGCI
jgi:hypothetical protein